MKTARKSVEVKRSIFKGLDEAINITKNFPKCVINLKNRKVGVAVRKNNNKYWSIAEERKLKSLVKKNNPVIVIGLKLGRTPGAVQSKASDLKVSLKPSNQSPYNRADK